MHFNFAKNEFHCYGTRHESRKCTLHASAVNCKDILSAKIQTAFKMILQSFIEIGGGGIKVHETKQFSSHIL